MSPASWAPKISHCTPHDSPHSGCIFSLGTPGTSVVDESDVPSNGSPLKQPTFLKPILVRTASLTYISSMSTRCGPSTPAGSPLPPPDSPSFTSSTPMTARRNALKLRPGSVL